MNYKDITITQDNNINSIFHDQVDDEYFDKNENEEVHSLSTPELISIFFKQVSAIWVMEKADYKNLSILFNSIKISAFDDSFNQFKIADLAVQKTLNKIDDPKFLIDLLRFLHMLIEVDKNYIDSLIRAEFLEALFKIYVQDKNLGYSIEIFKCASSISKTSIELRDYVFTFFDTIMSNSIIMFTNDSTVLNELFLLIATFMEFEIDSSMFHKISSFLISKEKILVIFEYLRSIESYHNNLNKAITSSYQDSALFLNDDYTKIKRNTCEKFAACLWKLSFYPDWIPFFKENNLNNLFIELLFSKDKYIPLYAAYSLVPIWENEQINDSKLIYSIINLLFHSNGSVVKIACHAIKCLIFVDENIITPVKGLIINQLMELATNGKCEIRIASFIAMMHFLNRFQDSIPYTLDKGLMDLIDDFFDIEYAYYFIPYVIPILDIIFTNEERNGDSTLLDDFANNRGGFDALEAMLLNTEKDEIPSLEYGIQFLAKYNWKATNYEEVDLK